MGHPSDLPHRAGTVHDPLEVQAAAELGHHRQRAQQLLHTGRPIGEADRTQTERRAAHPENLPQLPTSNTTTNPTYPHYHSHVRKTGLAE